MSAQPTVSAPPGGAMAFLNNRRIVTKIMLGYLWFIILIIVVAGTGYWGMTQIIAAEDAASKRQDSATELQAMQMYMIAKYANQADLLLNDDSVHIEEFRTSARAVAEKQKNLEGTAHTAEEAQSLAEIARLTTQFDALFLEQIVPAWKAGDETLIAKLDDQSDGLLTQIQDNVQKILLTYGQDVTEAHAAAEAVYAQTIQWMLWVAVVAIVAGLGFGLFLARNISNPVQLITGAAARLAMGDVAQQVTIFGRDEVGQMAEAFRQMIGYQQQMAEVADQMAQGDLTANITPQSDKDVLGHAFAQMTANLRDLVGQVAESANAVGIASNQLAIAAEQTGQATQQVTATIQQVAQGTTLQTQAVTETTNNVEQMARAADGIARGAQEQAQGVQKTSVLVGEMANIVEQVGQVALAVTEANAKVTQAARSGVTSVQQTGRGMDTIHLRTTSAAEKVKEMGARSKEIGRIVETIDDIADKTDMLALNAAVEAARAGEHGRGFAVVADQVRKLSEDSKGATRDIADLIERVQETVREAVGAMESAVTEVGAGTRLAADTSRALEDILQAAEQAAGMAGQIAKDTTQLKNKSEGVVAAIESVSAIVEENTSVAEEMAAGSQEVMQAMEGVASVAEENSASAEEVSASAEEMSAQVEEVVASAQEMASLADQLRTLVAQFRVDGVDSGQSERASRQRKPVTAGVKRAQPVMTGHIGNGRN